MFSGKIYTAGTNFARPPVMTVATNLNSALHRTLQLEKYHQSWRLEHHEIRLYMALWRFRSKGWMEWSGYPKENISCIDWLASSSLMSQYCLPNSGNENISESWWGTCVHMIGPSTQCCNYECDDHLFCNTNFCLFWMI